MIHEVLIHFITCTTKTGRLEAKKRYSLGGRSSSVLLPSLSRNIISYEPEESFLVCKVVPSAAATMDKRSVRAYTNDGARNKDLLTQENNKTDVRAKYPTWKHAAEFIEYGENRNGNHSNGKSHENIYHYYVYLFINW